MVAEGGVFSFLCVCVSVSLPLSPVPIVSSGMKGDGQKVTKAFVREGRKRKREGVWGGW